MLYDQYGGIVIWQKRNLKMVTALAKGQGIKEDFRLIDMQDLDGLLDHCPI